MTPAMVVGLVLFALDNNFSSQNYNKAPAFGEVRTGSLSSVI